MIQELSVAREKNKKQAETKRQHVLKQTIRNQTKADKTMSAHKIVEAVLRKLQLGSIQKICCEQLKKLKGKELDALYWLLMQKRAPPIKNDKINALCIALNI